MPRKIFLSRQTAAPLNTRRLAFSILAIIADNDEIQKLLPQVIIANDRCITSAGFGAVVSEVRGSKVELWRRKTAWVDAPTLAAWLHHLGRCLAPLQKDYFFILSMDACPVHMTETVAKAAAVKGIHLCFVPASMTGYMQPLDTHVFAKLKRCGRILLEDCRTKAISGQISVPQTLKCWAEAVNEVLTLGSHLRAFRSCGFGDQQKQLGSRLTVSLQLNSAVAPRHDLPTLAQLQCIPQSRRLRLPIGWWFHLVRHYDTESGGHAVAAPAPETLTETEAAPHAWAGRLRSSAASTQAADSQAPPESCPPPTATMPESPAQGSQPRARRLPWPRALRLPDQ